MALNPIVNNAAHLKNATKIIPLMRGHLRGAIMDNVDEVGETKS